MENVNNSIEEEKIDHRKIVSFSQYSIYLKCPHKWELDYIKGLRLKEQNIHTTFGTAIHCALQNYLVKVFNEKFENNSGRSLAEIAYDEFLEKFKEEYKTVPIENQNTNEFNAFSIDGKLILNEIFNPINLERFFSPKDYELIGVELPLETGMINNVRFMGYIDIILRSKHTGRVKIIDIKTSRIGWTKYMKEDISKYSQVFLYKHICSKIYNIPRDQIDVEYFILKREIDNYDRMKGIMSRIQIFVPEININQEKEAVNGFVDFLQEGFNMDGTYTDKELKKNPGEKCINCKFCQYYKTKYCSL